MAGRIAVASVLVTVDNLAPSFRLSLLAQNKSPRTIKAYMEAAGLLTRYPAIQGMPTEVSKLNREHLENFIADQVGKWKPATANNRYRALQQFFKWAQQEGEIKISPMQNMQPPRIPENPPPVLTDDQLRKLLRACDGRSFAERRDMAIIRLLLDTGMRRSELSGLKVGDVDLEQNIAVVMGKGRRPRACPFGRRTALALDRYLRARQQNRDATKEDLWLGHGGSMTDDGIAQIVRRRADKAGVDGIHMHLFRHTYAHKWLAAGSPVKWWAAMGPAPPMSEREKPIRPCHQGIGCDHCAVCTSSQERPPPRDLRPNRMRG